MLSIIVCSVDPARARWIEDHYRQLLAGVAHEFIPIATPPSLAAGYNEGIKRASGDWLIFSHDDIEFLDPPNWWPRLARHLQRFDLVGLAGTTRLIGPAWANAGPPYTFGQVGELDGQHAPYRALICGVPGPQVPDIQACDGLFFATRRELAARLGFDAVTFDGFHGYDIDFTFRAHLAGHQLGVATDLPVLHASQGNFDDRWEQYAQRFIGKHRGRLHPMTPRLFQHTIVCAGDKTELRIVLSGG